MSIIYLLAASNVGGIEIKIDYHGKNLNLKLKVFPSVFFLAAQIVFMPLVYIFVR